jgi:DNA end-binding protein Ku
MFVPERAIDPVYFEDTYYLGAGKNGERGYRVLVGALQQTHRVAVGTFTWRGKITPIAIRVHQDGLLLQRLNFTDEVQNAAELDQGAAPKIRDQERMLAERLISELSGTEFPPENYEDEYRKRLLKAIEQKVAGQEIHVSRLRPGPRRLISSRRSRRASAGRRWRRRHARTPGKRRQRSSASRTARAS